MKILITGGAGFIGSILCSELLNDNHKIIVIDKLIYGISPIAHLLPHKNFKFIQGDIRNISDYTTLIKQQDIIIPLAALVGAPICKKYPKISYQTNEKAIKSLLEITSKKQKIIFLNSNSGYGAKIKQKIYNEDSPMNPNSIYGITKKNAEDMIVKNSNFIIFRLATVFGISYRMRDDVLVHNFVKTAIKKKKLDVYEPEFNRNFIHISDLVKAIKFSIENFEILKGEIYNLGLSKENISKYALAKKIAKKVKGVVIKKINGPKDPDKRNYIISNKKIEKKGFKTNYSLDKGIDDLIKFYSNL